jgi:tetratricopeptide (TPR) repeat protein
MSYNFETDDELLRGVLYRADDSTSCEDTDEGDELVALFLEGQLKGDDRVAFFQYLDTHPKARQSLACGLQSIEHQAVSMPAGPSGVAAAQSEEPGWLASAQDRLRQFLSAGPQRSFAYGMAAVLLVGMTTMIWLTSQGPHSARLAILSGPSPMDYGIAIDRANDMEIRGERKEFQPQVIQPLLDTIPNDNERQKLKSGYDHLVRNQFPDALSAFEDAKKSYATRYYAWVGEGIAHLKNQKLEAAEAAFREALKCHEHPNEAQIGLAMALERQGHEDALAEWERVDLAPLSPEDRQDIARVKKRLQKSQITEPDNLETEDGHAH